MILRSCLERWRTAGLAGTVVLLVGACAVPPPPPAAAPPPAAQPPVTPLPEKIAQRKALRERLATIRLMACLSARAYGPVGAECPPSLLAQYRISETPFTPPIAGRSRGYTGQYIVAVHRARPEQIVAIRGTAGAEDALIDADIGKIFDRRLGVPVHSGFQAYASSIFDDVKANLRPNYQTYVTGHSLGGAVALLVGLYFYAENPDLYPIKGIYTFGQPRLFDNDGATAWPLFAGRVIRVVDCDDPVTLVPIGDRPSNTLINIGYLGSAEKDQYKHLGESLVLMDSGVYWMPGANDVYRSLSRNISDTLRNLLHRQKSDHSIEVYIRRLDALGVDGQAANPVNPGDAAVARCSPVAPGR